MEPTSMKYARLGKSGLRVSKVLLYVASRLHTYRDSLKWINSGCASYGAVGSQGWGVDDENEGGADLHCHAS